jgi:HEPN domain-containing protein
MGLDDILNERFNDGYSFYFFRAHEFAHSADCLEKIADTADKTWSVEIDKLNLKPGGGFTNYEETIEMHNASNDRLCRRISVYLFIHSVELALKGVYIAKTNTHTYEHKITKIYQYVKNYIPANLFNSSDLDKLFTKCDEMLIWAGRYPNPKNNKYKHDAMKNLAEIKHPNGCISYTSNIVVALDNIADGNGIKLLKDFLKYILNSFSPFHRNTK